MSSFVLTCTADVPPIGLFLPDSRSVWLGVPVELLLFTVRRVVSSFEAGHSCCLADLFAFALYTERLPSAIAHWPRLVSRVEHRPGSLATECSLGATVLLRFFERSYSTKAVNQLLSQ